jgi:DNA-binding NarL/FixJ family response regulator
MVRRIRRNPPHGAVLTDFDGRFSVANRSMTGLLAVSCRFDDGCGSRSCRMRGTLACLVFSVSISASPGMTNVGCGALMSIRIAIVDPLPMFGRGVAATLGEAGFDADLPADLMAWLQPAETSIVLLTLATLDDWRLLERASQTRPDVLVVAVLEDTSPDIAARAIAVGAVGVVRRDAGPALVHDLVRSLLTGLSPVPVTVLRTLATASVADSGRVQDPSADEVEWLRRLATGSTVAELARQTGYSERMMFRLLRALYGKLHVANRTEAIMHAHDRGLL